MNRLIVVLALCIAFCISQSSGTKYRLECFQCVEGVPSCDKPKEPTKCVNEEHICMRNLVNGKTWYGCNTHKICEEAMPGGGGNTICCDETDGCNGDKKGSNGDKKSSNGDKKGSNGDKKGSNGDKKGNSDGRALRSSVWFLTLTFTAFSACF